MVRSKHHNAFFTLFLFLLASCLTCSRNQESNSSKKNDSILNAQVKAMIDSTLSPYIRLQWESFTITSSYSNNDTVKSIKGTLQSDQYFNKSFDVAGSYKIYQNSPVCKYLSVSYEKVGNIFEMKEMYDSLFTFYTDSALFLEKLNQYWEHPDEEDQIVLDRFNLVERTYANKTKVHFGISEYKYKTLGKDYQRNFYEGLIGKGAFELAKPKFCRNKFIGFEIIGGRDKSFDFAHVWGNAKLVEDRKIGYGAHEMFIRVFVCELCRIKISSRYDKFDRVTKHSLEVYWKE